MLYLPKRFILLAGLVVTVHFSDVQAASVHLPHCAAYMRVEGANRSSKKEMLYKMGVDAFNKGQYKQAKKYFLMGVELGDVNAQLKLAYMYYEGNGVPKIQIFAAKYFNMAAMQGNAEAQEWVGYMYYNGVGLERNYGKALVYYHQAAASGRVTALYNLARMYQLGHGVDKDMEKAVDLYRMAAKRGYNMAEQALTDLGR